MFEELLTRQVTFLDAFLRELFHNFGFGSNRSMVGAGNPAGIFPLHACTAHKNILNGIVQHVAHVQHASHVWRRYHHRIRLSAVGLA